MCDNLIDIKIQKKITNENVWDGKRMCQFVKNYNDFRYSSGYRVNLYKETETRLYYAWNIVCRTI